MTRRGVSSGGMSGYPLSTPTPFKWWVYPSRPGPEFS
jgi:hypothetical protein